MIKNLLKIFLGFLIIIILFIAYLSVFGIKTNKFNELIKLQVTQKDNRFNLELDDVYIKLNINEASFSLNSQNIKLYINKEYQKFANVDLLIELDTIFQKDKKIKKIILNSEPNEIISLLKFIRSYELNIPVLYLENSVTKGKIAYNIIINFADRNLEKIVFDGKIINSELNILGKEKFKNVNFDFHYKDKKLNIKKLKIKYKNINFDSPNTDIHIKKNSIDIEGDLKNKINIKFIKNFIKYDFEKYLDKYDELVSKSYFKIKLSNKFKLIDYKLNSKIDISNIKLNFRNKNFKNYIVDYQDTITLTNGELEFNYSNKNKLDFKIISKYNLNEIYKPKDIYFEYNKIKSKENYNFKIDLFENELIINEIDFHKKAGEELFLNLNMSKNKNNYQIKDFRMFGGENNFIFKNVKFGKNYKIINFDIIEAKYLNKNNFMNDVLIKQRNNNIEIYSKKIDLTFALERALKATDKIDLFQIFQNLNTAIIIDVEKAKLDKDHNLNNLKGTSFIKKNKTSKMNLSANFNSNNKFVYTIDVLDGKRVATIYSDLAKPFVKKFKFIKGFEGGKLDFTSTEIDQNLFESELRIYNFKLRNMPALTKLLSLASLQGIADIATGQGIRFNEFEMYFVNSEKIITINEIYALGPAISILMEGYVEKDKLVSLKGTLVPATTINRTIAKIPLVGDLLVGEKSGEGVFGVSFKIKGPQDKLDTRVNPIKTLTPRFITRTLDNLKKSN